VPHPKLAPNRPEDRAKSDHPEGEMPGRSDNCSCELDRAGSQASRSVSRRCHNSSLTPPADGAGRRRAATDGFCSSDTGSAPPAASPAGGCGRP
jgi:hypothetical protein